MYDTTTEPSPTADATRLTEFARTSPTAKMPGMLVAYGLSSKPSVLPVRIKPLLSSRTVPDNQPVFGSAPIITNTAEISLTIRSPVFELAQVTLLRDGSPSSATISDSVWTVMWPEFSIREIKYCDIVSEKDGRRTI